MLRRVLAILWNIFYMVGITVINVRTELAHRAFVSPLETVKILYIQNEERKTWLEK